MIKHIDLRNTARPNNDDFPSDKVKDEDSSSVGGVPSTGKDKSKKTGTTAEDKEREEREEGGKLYATIADNNHFCNQIRTSRLYDIFEFTEMVKVFDGSWSMRRRMFRTITVSRNATLENVLAAALRAFHIRRDPSHYYLTDAYTADEKELIDSLPLPTLLRQEGKRPALFLRLREEDEGELEIFPSHLHGVVSHRIVKVNNETTVQKIIETACPLFGFPSEPAEKFQLTEMTLDKGGKYI
jgi:hypothetical protein